MSILQGVKACNYKPEKAKFVIKPKLSAKENRQEGVLEQLSATDGDVIQFIEYMIGKSMRLREMIEKRGIYNEQTFYQKHLLNSICLKTIVKQILDRMMNDRRLGKNLKGMNKSNLNEIENAIWSIVQRQANLYLNDLQYTRQKQQLKTDLKRRKEEIEAEIQKLTNGKGNGEGSVMLTENEDEVE